MRNRVPEGGLGRATAGKPERQSDGNHLLEVHFIQRTKPGFGVLQTPWWGVVPASAPVFDDKAVRTGFFLLREVAGQRFCRDNRKKCRPWQRRG